VWSCSTPVSRSFGKAVCDRWHAEALARCASDGTLCRTGARYLDVFRLPRYVVASVTSYAMPFRRGIARAHLRVPRRRSVTRSAPVDVTQMMRRITTSAVESHDGRDLLVHRKGAVRTTDATGAGVLVTIPGHADGSYIGP